MVESNAIKIDRRSTIDLSDEPIVDSFNERFAIPNTLSKTISNIQGPGEPPTLGYAILAYFLNEDSFNTTPTDNGSGSGSVLSAYQDGWDGKGYNQLARTLNKGLGILCYGFTMVFLDYYTSAQDVSGLINSNPNYISHNNVNRGAIEIGKPLNEGIRFDQFQTGTMTLLRKFYLSCINQISYNVPFGGTASMIVMTKPQKH